MPHGAFSNDKGEPGVRPDSPFVIFYIDGTPYQDEDGHYWEKTIAYLDPISYLVRIIAPQTPKRGAEVIAPVEATHVEDEVLDLHSRGVCIYDYFLTALTKLLYSSVAFRAAS